MSEDNLKQKTIDNNNKDFDPYAEEEVYVIKVPEEEIKAKKRSTMELVMEFVFVACIFGGLCGSMILFEHNSPGYGLAMFGLCWMAIGVKGIAKESSWRNALDTERKSYMNYEKYDEQIIEDIDYDIEENKNQMFSSVAMLVVGLVMVIAGVLI